MSVGYSGTPLWKKLGVHAGDSLLLIEPPRGWSAPDLPEGVTVALGSAAHTTSATAEIVIAFFSTLAGRREEVPELAPRIFPAGVLWVAWPRLAAGHDSDIRDQDIREIALPLGLVDVKVAALDEDWSGLRLVWQRELRHTSPSPSG